MAWCSQAAAGGQVPGGCGPSGPGGTDSHWGPQGQLLGGSHPPRQGRLARPGAAAPVGLGLNACVVGGPGPCVLASCEAASHCLEGPVVSSVPPGTSAAPPVAGSARAQVRQPDGALGLLLPSGGQRTEGRGLPMWREDPAVLYPRQRDREGPPEAVSPPRGCGPLRAQGKEAPCWSRLGELGHVVMHPFSASLLCTCELESIVPKAFFQPRRVLRPGRPVPHKQRGRGSLGKGGVGVRSPQPSTAARGQRAGVAPWLQPGEGMLGVQAVWPSLGSGHPERACPSTAWPRSRAQCGWPATISEAAGCSRHVLS